MVVIKSSFPILGFYPAFIKRESFKEVAKTWHWCRTFLGGVAVILIGETFVAVKMILDKYVKPGDVCECVYHLRHMCCISNISKVVSFLIGLIGSTTLVLEYINFVCICQDDNRKLRMAILILEAFSFVALVSSFIFFRAGYLSCCAADLCHKNQVGNGTHSDPNESGRSKGGCCCRKVNCSDFNGIDHSQELS